jgi:hypothetical protein
MKKIAQKILAIILFSLLITPSFGRDKKVEPIVESYTAKDTIQQTVNTINLGELIKAYYYNSLQENVEEDSLFEYEFGYLNPLYLRRYEMFHRRFPFGRGLHWDRP